MLTTFTLLVVMGGALRLALGWGLHRRYQLVLSVPQALAGEYGEPDIELVLRVLSPDSSGGSQGTA